jgi:hypothetical protein
MAEGVIYAPKQPFMFLGKRTDLSRAQAEGSSGHIAGLLNYQQEALGRTTERLGAEIPVWRRLVLHPKRCSIDAELADDILMIVGAAEAIDLLYPERRLVELNRLSTAAD